MSKISEKLTRSKNEPRRFDHNGQIKEFLVETGLASQFNMGSPGAKETVQAIHCFNHKTHLLLAALYLGYDDPKHNGYVLWCIPKCKCSYWQFMEFCKKVLDPRDERILGGGLFWSSPGNPSN
jgi:hypothetical protein